MNTATPTDFVPQPLTASVLIGHSRQVLVTGDVGDAYVEALFATERDIEGVLRVGDVLRSRVEHAATGIVYTSESRISRTLETVRAIAEKAARHA